MDHRSVFLIGAVLGAAVLGSVACAGPGPGVISFSEGSSDAVSADPDKPGKSSTSSSSGASPAASDPVFKGSAFAAGTAAHGNAKGQAAHSVLSPPANAALDPSGLNCMQASCHIDSFAFGGTVYADFNGTKPVAGAEVRVTGPDGTTYASGFSDADGNFYVDSVGVPIPAKSKVGVRKGDKTSLMNATISGADGAKCNSATGCHGSATMRIMLD